VKNPEIDGMPRLKIVTLLSGEKNEKKPICVGLKQPYGGFPA
jgi:hypothetical protein